MAPLLVLVCWVCTLVYLFGHKLLGLYGFLYTLCTHFIPLGPLALVVLALVLIVAISPKREAE